MVHVVGVYSFFPVTSEVGLAEDWLMESLEQSTLTSRGLSLVKSEDDDQMDMFTANTSLLERTSEFGN